MPDPSSVPALPLFYAQPVALDLGRHKSWRLLPGDAAFAAADPSVPLTASEFAAASRSYPIVFAASDASPVALMGLELTNLFVEAGQWVRDTYVPAYVRRYPFVLIDAADKQSFALGVDAASPRVAEGGRTGVALFEDDKPAEVTRQALAFCGEFNADHQRAKAFCAALAEADLLVERRIDATLPDGRKLGVAGFKVVEPERLAALPDDKVLAWHRSGWLALAHFHLASLERLNDLLARQAARTPAKAADALEPQVLQ